MKTQLSHTKNLAGFTFLIMSLFLLSSCDNSNKKTSEKESVKTELQKPPAIDLHTATFMGDLISIQQHIKAGSNLNLKESSMGSTPLITASVFGKTEIALALINAGADVNIQNNEGSTALHSAAFFCRTEIVKALLNKDVDLSLKNKYGSIPIDGVSSSFNDVKPIYDQFIKNLGPLGLKLDYEYLEKTRPVIASLLKNNS